MFLEGLGVANQMRGVFDLLFGHRINVALVTLKDSATTARVFDFLELPLLQVFKSGDLCLFQANLPPSCSGGAAAQMAPRCSAGASFKPFALLPRPTR